MGPVLKRSCSATGLVLSGVICCVLLSFLQLGDPLSQQVRWTYRDLLRGPLVLAQDDPAVVGLIRSVLRGPSAEPYKLMWPQLADTSEHGQLAHLQKIFGDKKGGTFLEVGAFDGEIHSNTLFLERFMGWTGLLVEAENWNYRQMLLTHRKANTLNVCIATSAYPQQLGFEEMPGSLLSYVDPAFKPEESGRQIRPRQCFPLFSVLLAAGLTSLDLLSLDLEGIEYLVLKTLPWNKVDIKVVIVDYVKPDFRFENGSFDPILEEPIKQLMLANSYILAHQLETDLIFVKNSSEYVLPASV